MILLILSLKRALSFEDVVWRIPRRLLSAWQSLVSECNDLSIWLNWLMPTIKVLPKRTYGLEDVVWRISRCMFSAWPFFISGWDNFSYSESPCYLTHSIKFLPKGIYGLEKVVAWEFRDGCLMHGHLWYLNGMKEAFMSLFLAWSIQSSFCSSGHMVWRRMLFEKYQDCCLVLGHPDILFIQSLHVVLFLLKRTYSSEVIAWRVPRWLFNAWPYLISEWNDLSN